MEMVKIKIPQKSNEQKNQMKSFSVTLYDILNGKLNDEKKIMKFSKYFNIYDRFIFKHQMINYVLKNYSQKEIEEYISRHLDYKYVPLNSKEKTSKKISKKESNPKIQENENTGAKDPYLKKKQLNLAKKYNTSNYEQIIGTYAQNNEKDIAKDPYLRKKQIDLAKKYNTSNYENIKIYDSSIKKEDSSKVLCPNCKFEIGPSDNFCISCGKKINTSNICPKCKKKAYPSDIFCYYCGTKLR